MGSVRSYASWAPGGRLAAGRRIPDWVHPRSGGAVVASRTYAPASDAPGEGACSWSRATGGETEPEAKAPPDVRPPMMSGGRSAPSAQAAQAQETGIPMAVGEELECMRTEIVRAGLALDHEFEATVARLKPDSAALIRPRADQLWKRVPKERTLKGAAAVFGEEWAERHAKLKRPALAEAVEAAFAGTGPSVDEEGRQRAAEWTLPGFAPFDTRRLGDEPGGRGGRKGAGRRKAGKKKAAVAKKKAAKAADEPHGAEVTEARGTAETGTAAA